MCIVCGRDMFRPDWLTCPHCYHPVMRFDGARFDIRFTDAFYTAMAWSQIARWPCELPPRLIGFRDGS